MQVNPYRDADTPERQQRRRQVFVALGVALALGGSYLSITEAFGEETFCNSLGCFSTRDPVEIWIGVVMVVAGALIAWRNWRHA